MRRADDSVPRVLWQVHWMEPQCLEHKSAGIRGPKGATSHGRRRKANTAASTARMPAAGGNAGARTARAASFSEYYFTLWPFLLNLDARARPAYGFRVEVELK